MTESIIQPDPCLRDFSIFDLTVLLIYRFKVASSKFLYTVLSSLCILLNSETSFVTNLKPFNSINKSISLFLNSD